MGLPIIPSIPITSWQIDGATMETVKDFIFGMSKITAYGDCSHEIKRHSLLGRKAMTNLDSILKSRDITLPTKVCLVKAMVFSVVIYACESWTIKKAECWRIDVFELWCWRRLLRIPWTARRSNQSILKESVPNIHWKEWCGSWNSSTLATCCKELTHWKRSWCWERLKAGREGDNGEWDDWMASLTWWTWLWVGSGNWWCTGKPGVLQSMGSQRVGHDWATELNLGLPSGANCKEPACQCRRCKRCRLDCWVGKIPWRRAWQPTPVFLPEESMDRGAWQAAVHRIGKNRSWLKRLSYMHTHLSVT